MFLRVRVHVGRGWRAWCSRAVCEGRGLDLTTVRSILPCYVPTGTSKCLSEEEGGCLGSRWTQCPAQVAGQRRDVEEYLEEWQVRLCETIFSCVAPKECNTQLRQQSVGLRWNSSALPKIRWLVWTHVSCNSHEKRQKVAHPMIRYPSPMTEVSKDPALDSCLDEVSATCREMVTLQHISQDVLKF